MGIQGLEVGIRASRAPSVRLTADVALALNRIPSAAPASDNVHTSLLPGRREILKLVRAGLADVHPFTPSPPVPPSPSPYPCPRLYATSSSRAAILWPDWQTQQLCVTCMALRNAGRGAACSSPDRITLRMVAPSITVHLTSYTRTNTNAHEHKHAPKESTALSWPHRLPPQATRRLRWRLHPTLRRRAEDRVALGRGPRRRTAAAARVRGAAAADSVRAAAAARQHATAAAP